MAPKKKGKQNKLAKLSDEDRLRYLQHKAAQEEEARRRKQQLVANFVKVDFILDFLANDIGHLSGITNTL